MGQSKPRAPEFMRVGYGRIFGADTSLTPMGVLSLMTYI